jgi:mannose-6-phosphate isomerase-like protein (cupin superfamily)
MAMSTSLHPGRSTSQEELTVGSDRIVFRLTSEQGGGEIAVFDVTIPAGGGPPMLHRHDAFELYRVRTGELAIYLQGNDGAVRRTVAGPGAVVPIDSGLEHTIRNESDQEAQASVIFSPAESMERFARAANDLGQTPAAHQVLALAEAHGIEITRSIEDALTNTATPADPAPELHAAYLTIARFSGDPDRLQTEYQKTSDTMSAVGRDHGIILHAAAKTESGFLILNLWPSKDSSESAAGDPRRLRILERANVSPSQIQREHHDVAYLVVFDSPARC